MKTAVIQLNAKSDKKNNIGRAVDLVHKAAGRKAEFILLPEAFNFRGRVPSVRGYKDIAEKLPGPSTIPLMAAAKKRKVFILAGSVCEYIPGKKKVCNTSVLINPAGNIVAKYRKNHLFNAVIGTKNLREEKFFSAGKRTVLAKVGPWTAGLSICYDLRFPGLYKTYKSNGADIFCVPSVFTQITGRAHWEILLRARAIENFCYVLAPNQIGKDGQGVASYGNSMIVGPWGEVLARAGGNREEIIFARLDKKILHERRKILPGRGIK